jgi:hypothetical protein
LFYLSSKKVLVTPEAVYQSALAIMVRNLCFGYRSFRY